MTNITAPHFHDETKAREHLEAIRWPEGPFCPHCGSFNATRLEGKKHRTGLIQCNDCREQYTVTVGTVFERRSEEHTSELQSLMRNSYAVFCLKKKKNKT